MASSKPATLPLPNWDADSPALRHNLQGIDSLIRVAATRRDRPSFEDARDWHKIMMRGLDPGMDPVVVGGFRGEPGMENMGVYVGTLPGTMPWLVGAELQVFEDELRARLQVLDKSYLDQASLDGPGRGKVIEVAAWAHSEWVRIHPFANGNGRTARMWANVVLLRYGMPPVMRYRPRPAGAEYASAGKAGMQGVPIPARAFIRRLVDEELKARRAAATQAAKPKPRPPVASKKKTK